MLVALKNGKWISLAEKHSQEELKRLKALQSLVCPVCEHPVQLKAGPRRMPHFAHLKDRKCKIEYEKESDYHIKGKTDLYDWLKNDGFHVKLEPYLKTAGQRPDLLVSSEGTQFAIEYQCSTIPRESFFKRTAFYKRTGIRPIWILGAKNLRRRTSHSYSLSPFHWLFAVRNAPEQSTPSITSYCPDLEAFIILTDLYPFSAYTAFSNVKIIPIKKMSFQELLMNRPGSPLGIEREWLRKKSSSRLTMWRYNTFQKFVAELYRQNIIPSLMPSEIGMPVPSGVKIETPALIWQMWLWLDYLLEKSEGEIITLQEAAKHLFARRESGEIKQRATPLDQITSLSGAVREYLDVLSELGILKRAGSGLYRKMQNPAFPKTLEDGYRQDNMVMERHLLARQSGYKK